MKKSVFILSLLSGTAFMFPCITIASGIPTHSHTSGLKPALQFVDMSKAFKTAAICFMGSDNCGDSGFAKTDDDLTIDAGKRCQNEGFSLSCSAGWHPKIGADCPYNSLYKKCCKEDCPAKTTTAFNGNPAGGDGCGYTCRYCSDACPEGTSKNYTGSLNKKNECDNACNNPNTDCPSGYVKAACGYGKKQTAFATTESGTSCYKCEAKTCSDGGYQNACSAGQTGTTVSYEGLTCVKDCKTIQADCNLWTNTPECTARCKAAGYIYHIWDYNSCGGHYQHYYVLPEHACPYNLSYSKYPGCGVCSDIPDDHCASSHPNSIDMGRTPGRNDFSSWYWFDSPCDWVR